MKFNILQGFRGVAAALVVGYHAMGEARRLYPEASSPLLTLFSCGGIGVDLFFVVSGFIIAMSADGSAGLGAGLAYLRKRIIRIVPLYWAFTLVLVGSSLTAYPLISPEVPLTPGWIATSLLFSPPDLAQRITPIVFVGWTLNYEMLFYALVFAAVLLGRPALAPLLILLLVGIGLVVPLVAPLTAPAAAPATWYAFVTNPIMLEFVLGYAVFTITKHVRIGRGASLAIMGLGTVALLASYALVPEVPGLMRPLINGPLLAVLVLGAVCVEACAAPVAVPRWIVRSGDASYSIYLLQVVTLPLATPLLIQLGLTQLGPDAVALIIVAATVALGILVYDVIERPLMDLARAAIPAPSTPAATAPPRSL